MEFFTLRKEMTELPYQYQCDGELQDVLSKTKYGCKYCVCVCGGGGGGGCVHHGSTYNCIYTVFSY